MTKEDRAAITQARLRELMFYDPVTGVFIRKQKTSNNVSVGDIVGCKRKDGYVTASVDGVLYLMHQLAWLYEYGFIPPALDHVNRRRSDNALRNLRECTLEQNNWNQRVKSTNTSGVQGVHWDSRRSKWMATIRSGKKTVALGRFDQIEDAENAYLNAVSLYRGHFLEAR